MEGSFMKERRRQVRSSWPRHSLRWRVSEGKMTQVNDAEGQGGRIGKRISFSHQKPYCGSWGTYSLCSIFFYSFYWVFRIWSAAAPCQTFPVVSIIPISHNCPVRAGCQVPILKMRKLIREVDLHNITCLYVTAGPNMKCQSYLAHAHPARPGIIMGNHRPQWKHRCLW